MNDGMEATPHRGPWSWIAENVRPALLPFLASRLVCVLAVYLVTVATDHNVEQNPFRPVDPAEIARRDPERFKHRNLLIDWCSRWDGGWYLSIVRDGYSYQAGKQSNVVFFPFFPLLVTGIGFLGVPPTWGGVVVSNAAFLAALAYVYALGRRLLPDRASAERALWLLALFPTAFFFSALFTESLYLLCCVAAIYHAHARQWVAAVAFAALASACRVKAETSNTASRSTRPTISVSASTRRRNSRFSSHARMALRCTSR